VRLAALIFAGLALAAPAFGQSATDIVEISKTAKPHSNLPGFELVRNRGGQWWWRRTAGDNGLGQPTWVYWATQTEYGHGEAPPLAVLAPPDPSRFGVNEAQMLSRPVRVGTTAVAELLPSPAPAPSAAPQPPEPEDAIGQFCRRYHLAREIVYGAIGLGSGILGAIIALLLRRILGR
jgi:hypothetical protein